MKERVFGSRISRSSSNSSVVSFGTIVMARAETLVQCLPGSGGHGHYYDVTPTASNGQTAENYAVGGTSGHGGQTNGPYFGIVDFTAIPEAAPIGLLGGMLVLFAAARLRPSFPCFLNPSFRERISGSG